MCVDFDVPPSVAEAQGELDLGAERTLEELFHPGEESVRLDPGRLKGLSPREGKQPARQTRRRVERTPHLVRDPVDLLESTAAIRRSRTVSPPLIA